MAARAAERLAGEYARLLAEAGPPVPGEDEYVAEDGTHAGHRTHVHPWHGAGVVTCSCGDFAGSFSFVLIGDAPDPEPCPVCTARGVPLGVIRATHPYVFRSGKWAKLVGTQDDPETGRRCYAVEFPDGMTDWWPVEDEAAGYEFR
jgi:hypothetical protein